MTNFLRRLRYRFRNHRFSPLEIAGITLVGAILLAIMIGNILNATLDDDKLAALKTPTAETPATPDVPDRRVQQVRAYPVAPGDDPTRITVGEGVLLDAVSVSLCTPDGILTYESPVSKFQGRESLSVVALADFMMDLTGEIPYVCGVYYPQALTARDDDVIYAAAATDAALLREFVRAGGSEILIAGASFDAEDLPYLGDYLKALKDFLGDTPVSLAVPYAYALSEDAWQILPALSGLCDLLTLDLSEVSNEEMEHALLTAPYYLSQYRMRLAISAAQSRWVAPVEAAFADYQIISTPATVPNG